MNTIIRTAWGAQVQTASLPGISMPSLTNSTINEALACNATATLTPADRPITKYVAIGNGGHAITPGVGGLGLPSPVSHRSLDVTLFNHLPFVLRLPTNDLTAIEATKYRMRQLVHVLSGVITPGPAPLNSTAVNYIAYYLKVLDTTTANISMMYNTVVNGAVTSTPYTPPVSGLIPVPMALANAGVNVTSGDYITVSALLPFVMTAADTAEYVNVCTIIYNDPNYAIISEIALVSGVERNVTNAITPNTTIPGTFVNSTYTDLVGAQVMSFISTFFAMQFNNAGIDFTLDIGASEPLWLVP